MSVVSSPTTSVVDGLAALGGRVVGPGGALPPRGTTPVVRLATAIPVATRDALLARAADGGRVVLVAGPSIDRAAVESWQDALRFGVGAELLGTSEFDPLLADSRRVALTPAGEQLHLDRVHPLRGPGRQLATIDGQAVALAVPVGAGEIVVLGTECLLHDRWLTWPANARFLAEVLGQPIDDAPARIDALHDGERPPHATPPVVVAEPWLDPDVVAGADPSELPRLAGHLGRLLPAAVHDALVDFADAPHDSGALLLRDMPVGAVPPTPLLPTAPTGKDLTSELSLLTVARRLGQPVGYLPEHGGTIVQNILPTPAAADRQVSTSSKVELMFHTEAAFHPHRPRFLVLLCLRGDPDGRARTTLASIREVLPSLSLRTRRVLFERRFRTAADESYVGGRPTQLGAPVSVLAGDWDRPSMVFDADLMVGTDEEADRALHELAAATAAHHTGVVLGAGDLLVVDNAVAVHGRSPFVARYDGTDRWLQRAFVVADLLPSAGERDGRIVTTRFAR